MKKLAFLLSFFTAFATYAADKILIAATAVPAAEVLEFIKPQLAKEGVELDIKVFIDYVQPNIQVAEKRFDANFFQHKPFMDDFNQTRKANLVAVTQVYTPPLGAYSQKLKNISELKDGAKVAIPNDPTNGGRALLLMAKNGLLKLKEGAGLTATPRDIVENPRKIVVTELEAAMLPRMLSQFDFAVINANYALPANLNPVKDTLFVEGADSPYANVLATRSENVNSPAIQKLAKALTSAETKKFILEKYKGSVIPAF